MYCLHIVHSSRTTEANFRQIQENLLEVSDSGSTLMKYNADATFSLSEAILPVIPIDGNSNQIGLFDYVSTERPAA